MEYSSDQRSWPAVLAVAAQQHGVVSHTQMRLRGYSAGAIKRLVARGFLHPCAVGAYAVGRPDLTRLGRLAAAVIVCGPDALISHASAAWLWAISARWEALVHLSTSRKVVREGIVAHRRYALRPEERTSHRGVPVTSPARTLADIALVLPPTLLERAVNDADKHNIIRVDDLREELGRMRGPGVARLRTILDAATFTLTDSELERRFLPISDAAGLPRPLTQQRVCGRRVDFFWPALGLVVETDGLRYHRTPASQAHDLERDHLLAAAGIERLRFSHSQVAYDPRRVQRVLAAVGRRLVNQVRPGDRK